MWLEFHRRQLDPVVAVGAQGDRVAVTHLGEEPTESVRRREPADRGAQCCIHVVADRDDLLFLEETHVLGDCCVEDAVVLAGAPHSRQAGKVAIAMFLESERRMGASQLTAHDGYLFLPAEWHQVHVVEVPRVVVPSYP